MGVSPVPVLIIVAIYAVFFAAISSTTSPDEPDDLSFSSNDCDVGLNNVCGLGDILTFVFNIIQFFFDVLTFNIDGAPFYIRVPIAVAITASVMWSIISLVRGTEG